MDKRYLVTDGESFEGVQVFSVEDTKADYPYKHIDVWVKNDRFNCTSCSGLLQAMLSNCPHTNAVRRHLKKEATNES